MSSILSLWGSFRLLRAGRCPSALLLCAAALTVAHGQTVSVGLNLSRVAVNSATNKIYVLGNTLTVIDGTTLATSSVPVSGIALAVNSATNKIYIASATGLSTGGVLTIVDGASLATSTVPLGVFNAAAIAVNPVTNMIYVANANTAGSVSVINGASLQLVNVAVGNQPDGIAVNTKTNRVYITEAGARFAAVMDGATNAITNVAVASGALGVVVDETTNKIYLASSPLTVIDGASNATTTVPDGPYPTDIGINTVTNTIYVSAIVTPSTATTDNGIVTVIDGATNTPTTVTAGVYPAALAVNSATNTVYVANEFGNTVTAITGGTNSAASIAAGANPYAIAVNPATNRIFVVNNGDSTVGVFAGPTTVAPVITSGPVSTSVATGSTAVFSVAAAGSPAPTYQWRLNGTAIAGATSARLVVPTAAASAAGTYTVAVSNASGTVVSAGATLTVVASSSPGRLENISVIYNFSVGQVLTVGFVSAATNSSGNQSLLIRGVGPSLSGFGIGNPMADPQFSLIPLGGTAIAANNDWGSPASNQSVVIAADTATGAFPLTVGSLDAALVTAVAPGPYSVRVTGTGAGDALTEVYDNTPSGTYTLTTPRLINISCETALPAGGSLTAGFTVGGTTSKTVLIRASGPALTQFGLTGTIADPQIVLQALGASTSLTQNAGWGGDPQIAAAATSVGAFGFPSTTSLDSAVLITLPAGGYTATVSSVSGGAGITLLEVYEVP